LQIPGVEHQKKISKLQRFSQRRGAKIGQLKKVCKLQRFSLQRRAKNEQLKKSFVHYSVFRYSGLLKTNNSNNIITNNNHTNKTNILRIHLDS